MNVDFSDRLAAILQQIEETAQAAGRKASEVQLIAASKTVKPDFLREAWDAGVTVFGENRAQELKAKAPLLPASCEWHFIGGLQTNKVKDVVPLAKLIHSVDRQELAEEIEKRAAQNGKQQQLLMEINVSGELSKHGAHLLEAEALLLKLNSFPRLEVVGLMTVAPFDEDLEKVRPYFATLRELRDRLERDTGCKLPELSMGMSHDFTAAIREGATMVRIGSALFGNRSQTAA